MAFLTELFSILSRFVNVLTGSTADITFSARSHRDSLRAERIIDWFAYIIFREQNHCARWWGREIERSRDNLERAAKGE